MPTKCIILAAGVGSRLQPLTNDNPKSCLEITNNESLIERVVRQLITFTDISEIIICVGFQSQRILDKLRDVDFNISYCHNADFETTNNMYSAWLALQNSALDHDVIVVNADCVYDDSIVQKLDMVERSSIFYDPAKWDDESMKIMIDDNARVSAISKAIEKDAHSYVSIDLYKIIGKDVHSYFSAIEKFINNGELNSWNELAIEQMIQHHGCDIYGVEIGSAPWFEIDTLVDYENAKTLFNN